MTVIQLPRVSPPLPVPEGVMVAVLRYLRDRSTLGEELLGLGCALLVMRGQDPADIANLAASLAVKAKS